MKISCQREVVSQMLTDFNAYLATINSAFVSVEWFPQLIYTPPIIQRNIAWKQIGVKSSIKFQLSRAPSIKGWAAAPKGPDLFKIRRSDELLRVALPNKNVCHARLSSSSSLNFCCRCFSKSGDSCSGSVSDPGSGKASCQLAGPNMFRIRNSSTSGRRNFRRRGIQAATGCRGLKPNSPKRSRRISTSASFRRTQSARSVAAQRPSNEAA